MTAKLVTACATPTVQSQREAYRWAVNTFAPELRFAPAERFFPVDLDSTVAASGLYYPDTTSSPPVWPTVKAQGQIQPPDLAAAPADHFTSVTPLVLGNKGNRIYLEPQITAVENLHANRSIPSKLTMYAVICRTGGVPNAHFFDEKAPRDAAVARAVKDGYLLNYYLFFPATDAPDQEAYAEAEGDWSGISLLFEKLPTAGNIASTQPVLCAYYRKAGRQIITGQDGFSKWGDVTRLADVTTGLDTHPVVYVSQGRHNCYYTPQSTTVPDVPWPSSPNVELVEAGSYTPNVGSSTITGHFDPKLPDWMFAVFGPAAVLFEFCAEMGCVEFDRSGIYSSWAPTSDSTADGGHAAQPPGAQSAPSSTTPPSTLQPGQPPSTLTIEPVLVDLTDPRMSDAWAFAGLWGAARMTRHTYWEDPNDKHSYERYETGGRDRPLLPAWFMFNLFLDPTFGAGGIGVLPPTP